MILIRSAQIISPGSSKHLQTQDIRIREGKITETGKALQADGEKEIQSKNLCVSPGWIDLGPQFGDPGFEHREGLKSGLAAAAKGGFTAVAPFPNTDPVIHSKSEVEYLINRSSGNIVSILPIGALTRDNNGTDIAEMIDMHQAGAVAFSDGRNAVQRAGVVERALLYVLPFNGLIILRPEDETLSAGGQMNEGTVSTSLGLRGLPELSETIAVTRDVTLLEYTGSRLLEFGVSSPESISLIKAAKKAGQKAYSSMNSYQFYFTDEDLSGFDTNLKVKPCLRSPKDVEQFKKAFLAGDIDIISSGHEPWDEEQKKVEFLYAEPGMASIELSYSILNTALGKDSDQEKIVQSLAINTREILGQESSQIEEGQKADITLFDPAAKWTVQESDLLSNGVNNPFIGKELTGKVLGIINEQQSQFA